MNKPKNLFINLGISFEGSIRYFGAIGVSNKLEIFYQFFWSADFSPSYFFDGLNGEEIDVRNVDHISFHKDGTIHIKYFTRRKEYILHRKLNSALDTMPSAYYAPLFVLSIYEPQLITAYAGMENPRYETNNKHIAINIQIEVDSAFSFIPFHVGGDVNINLMAEQLMPKLNSISRPVVIPDYMNLVDADAEPLYYSLAIAACKKLIPQPEGHLLIGPEKAKNHNHFKNMYGLRITPDENSLATLV